MNEGYFIIIIKFKHHTIVFCFNVLINRFHFLVCTIFLKPPVDRCQCIYIFVSTNAQIYFVHYWLMYIWRRIDSQAKCLRCRVQRNVIFTQRIERQRKCCWNEIKQITLWALQFVQQRGMKIYSELRFATNIRLFIWNWKQNNYFMSNTAKNLQSDHRRIM